MSALKLLIVDDELSIRTGLSNTIDWQSYDIEVIGTAKNCEEAMSIIKESNPHIVITDIQMPGGTGLDLIKKTIDMKLNTKYIIISGYDDFSYAQKAISLRVSSYLLKPVQTSKLIESIVKIKDQIKEEGQYIETSRKAHYGQKAMKEKFFNRVIDIPPMDTDLLRLEANQLNVDVPFESIYSIVIRYSLKKSISKDDFSREDAELLNFILHNMLNEVFESIPHESFNRKSQEISIILASEFISKKDLISKCESFIKLTYDYTGLNLIIGIGKPVDTLSLLGDSYRSALDAMDYVIYDSDCSVFPYLDPTAKGTTIPQANSLNTKEIIDGILRADDKAIFEATDAFLATLFYIPQPPPKYLKGMINYLIMDVYKKLETYGYQGQASSQLRNDVENASSYTYIKDTIIEHFVDAGSLLQETNPLLSDPVILETKAFISSHLGEKILLRDIAKHVHLSENYLATLFKKNTGKSFRDYVLDEKLSAAKALLIDSNKSISEIANELGYSDYRSFNRVFKNMTGSTPSEFHSKYRKGKNV